MPSSPKEWGWCREMLDRSRVPVGMWPAGSQQMPAFRGLGWDVSGQVSRAALGKGPSRRPSAEAPGGPLRSRSHARSRAFPRRLVSSHLWQRPELSSSYGWRRRRNRARPLEEAPLGLGRGHQAGKWSLWWGGDEETGDYWAEGSERPCARAQTILRHRLDSWGPELGCPRSPQRQERHFQTT